MPTSCLFDGSLVAALGTRHKRRKFGRLQNFGEVVIKLRRVRRGPQPSAQFQGWRDLIYPQAIKIQCIVDGQGVFQNVFQLSQPINDRVVLLVRFLLSVF